MSENGQAVRMIDKSARPTDTSVAAWVGQKGFAAWKDIAGFIEKNYPGVFPSGDWIYGGKKHGWGLRYKRSKAFCTLVPERGRVMVCIVLGAEEREKAETLLPSLSPAVRETYEKAATFHDGKWLLIDASRASAAADIKKLLALKRRPLKST